MSRSDMNDLYRVWYQTPERWYESVFTPARWYESVLTEGGPGKCWIDCRECVAGNLRDTFIILPSEATPAAPLPQQPEPKSSLVRTRIWIVGSVQISDEDHDGTASIRINVSGTNSRAYLTADALRDLADACDEVADALDKAAKP